MAAPPTKTPRTCSQCGNNGHNARTCTEPTAASSAAAAGFMLFGVRLTAAEGSPSSPSSSSSSFRKSMSMNNLSQYEHQQPQDFSGNAGDVAAAGYASDDAVHASGSRSRERKRGIPWSEEEHRLFLMGLNKVGKGDWRGISRNFVKTRTPTQVASHAQKYFLRRANVNRRRRRSSLFDITTAAVNPLSNESQLPNHQDSTSQSKQDANISTIFPSPYPPVSLPVHTKHARSIPVLPVPPSSKMASLNLNQSKISSPSSSTSTNDTREREYEPFLSLKVSQSPSDEESSRRSSSFGGFNGSGDSIISVA